jgi:hypothetical protein
MFQIKLPQWLTPMQVVLELALLTLPLLFFVGTPQPVYAATCSGTLDYGDAPSSYGVACANSAGTLRLGSVTPDEEAYPGFQSAGATGDSTNGTNDENFLNPLTPIDLAYPTYVWTVPVLNSTGSATTLVGWIDFDGNGTFDANERANANVPTNAATQNITLTWTIPVTATPNITTYARLRIMPTTTSSDWQPTGNFPNTTSNGEVEDYQVTTVQSIVCTPGRSFYYINGSTYTINTYDLSTGTSVAVNDPPSQTNINGLGVDQSNGIIYYQDADNSTTPDGIYYYNAVNNTNGTITDDGQTAPLNLPLGNGWQTASGAFGNGRYYAGIDGGDIGTIYEITLNAAGTAPVSARALITPNTGCGQTTCQNYGDLMVVGNRMYVAFWSNGGGPGETQWFDVYDINSQLRLSRQTLGSAQSATGFAFQLARDGNGQIYAITSAGSPSGRVYTVTNGLIEWGASGANPIRTIGTTVNDASECPISPMDFGDAPTSYGWDAGPRAARHSIDANLRLGNVSGTSTLRDLRGMSSANADGDDLAGGTDDEDAVASLPTLRENSTSYSIPNITVFNNTGSNATLYAWIDFNRDGQYQPSERATVTVPSSASTQSITVTWSSLSGLVAGPSFLRLRLSTATTTTSSWGTGNDGAFLATGYAANGEVEDYPITINAPTAIKLSSFTTQKFIDVNGEEIQKYWELGAALVLFAALGLYRFYRLSHAIAIKR